MIRRSAAGGRALFRAGTARSVSLGGRGGTANLTVPGGNLPPSSGSRRSVNPFDAAYLG
jgi:hypothetical protein